MDNNIPVATAAIHDAVLNNLTNRETLDGVIEEIQQLVMDTFYKLYIDDPDKAADLLIEIIDTVKLAAKKAEQTKVLNAVNIVFNRH